MWAAGPVRTPRSSVWWKRPAAIWWCTTAASKIAKGLLAAALPGADIVVFPVDCIDHDSMNTLKRVCERHQIDYHPLRTASVASFVELMARLHPEHLAQLGNPPPSAFCLRHG